MEKHLPTYKVTYDYVGVKINFNDIPKYFYSEVTANDFIFEAKKDSRIVNIRKREIKR